MQGDDNMQLIAEYAPYVLRADENVVSYEQFYDDYYGGAHGYHSYAVLPLILKQEKSWIFMM